MVFKSIILALLFISLDANAAHVTDRKVQATDIVNAAGVTVLAMPSSAPSPSRALVTNADGEVTGSATTATEVGWLSGVTSAIQTQLNATAKLIANTFTDTQTVTKTALGTTTADAIVGQNTTAATSGNQQVSPDIRLRGNGWKTNSTAASRPVEFREYVLPVQGTTNPLGRWKLQSQINSSGWSDALDFDTTILDGIAFPGFTAYGSITSSVNNSSTIGTLQNFTLSNPTGSKTQFANKFGSTIKSGITFRNDGAVEFKTTNPSTGYQFQTGSNIESQSYVVQIYGDGIFNAGLSANNGTVTAGSATATPPATLTTYGSYGSKGQYKTANFTVDTTGQFFYCDAANANVCLGTPSTSCAATAGGESGCNARSTLGCSWAAGGDCGTYTGTDAGTCTGANAACSWETAACSAYNNDAAGCASAGFPSGSQCSFTPAACSDFAGSQGACDAESANGCTSDLSSCSTWDGTDQSTCEATPPCTWNSGDNTCGGSYFTGCSGTYTGPNGACSGTYDTGTCAGGAWGSCSGSASCGGLLSSGACGGEPGCTWTSGMTATLPSIATAAASGGTDTTGPWVGIKNVGATGNVTVAPASGDTIEWASSSLTILPQPSPIPSQVPTNFVMLHPLVVKADCSVYNNNESSCSSTTGCGWSANTCGSYGSSGSCGSASGCSWNSETNVCEGTYSGSDGTCSGLYITAKKWMRW